MIDKREKEDEFLTITEAAELFHVTRQAIYVALKIRGLPAIFANNMWIIKKSDLIDYQKNKYSREKSTFNGCPLYDLEGGEYSVNHIAKLVGADPQHIYYLLRRGELRASKKGRVWIISREELERLYFKIHEQKNKQKSGTA